MTSTESSEIAKRWVVTEPGSIDNLSLSSVPVPDPGESEVRVKVRAVGLNFADIFTVLGLYGNNPPAASNPVTPGFEVAGVVDAVGQNAADHFHVGQRVFGMLATGAYSTFVNVPASTVFDIPNGWTFAQAAAFPVQTLTAYFSLVVLGGIHISPGPGPGPSLTSDRKAVLIHSAAGGVGLRVLQMVLKAGGTPVCVVGSDAKAQYLQEHYNIPRERIIVRRVDEHSPNSFANVVSDRALGGGDAKLDLVIDSMLGQYFEAGWNTLGEGGRYIVIGAANLMPSGSILLHSWRGLINAARMAWSFLMRPHLDLTKHTVSNRTLSTFNLGKLAGKESVVLEVMKAVLALDLPPATIGREFAFEDAREAMKFMQSGESVGKICLMVGDQE
jgi:synaptic vesicle membrane protein VAT-1